MKSYLLIGNFGVGNIGDEALQEYFLTQFSGVSWKVLSATPQGDELARLPAGVRSFLRFRWIKTLRALHQSDGVVFGGGTLFTDIESVSACFLWWVHAMAARVLGKHRIFAFQGVGPFRTAVGEWFARSALRNAAHISVRDTASKNRIEQWHMSTEIIQTFDPVFSLLVDKKIENRSQKILGVIPRNNSGATFRNWAQKQSKREQFDEVVILSFQPDDPCEQRVTRLLAEEVGGRVLDVRSVDDLAREVGKCTQIFTQRYHGAVVALALGVPFETVPQETGDKLATIHPLNPATCRELVDRETARLQNLFH